MIKYVDLHQYGPRKLKIGYLTVLSLTASEEAPSPAGFRHEALPAAGYGERMLCVDLAAENLPRPPEKQ